MSRDGLRPLFLIGYMGSGKTTLGQAVASAVSLRFIDLDSFIEQSSGMSVRRIFELHGEQHFRQVERETLQQVASMHDVIVATGGGTPCQPGLMDLMNEKGTTVNLLAPLDILHSRLCEGRAKRPLIASLNDDELKEFIKANLAAREPFYSRAHHSFDSSQLEDEVMISNSVKLFINTFLRDC